MTIECTLLGEFPLAPQVRLTLLSETAFAKAWKGLVGEPPATMLDDRSEMIRILVESTPLVPLMGSGLGGDG